MNTKRTQTKRKSTVEDVAPGLQNYDTKKPLGQMMDEGQLANLKRVLQMNNSTIQQTYQHVPNPTTPTPIPTSAPVANNTTPTAPTIIDPTLPPTSSFPFQLDPTQYNIYLYNYLMNEVLQQQQMQRISEQEAARNAQPSAQPLSKSNKNSRIGSATQPTFSSPFVQYSCMPFWTACPLPFSPLTYPQIIIPPSLDQHQQIGPQLLRPILPSPQPQQPATNGSGAVPKLQTRQQQPQPQLQVQQPQPQQQVQRIQQQKQAQHKDKRTKRTWSKNKELQVIKAELQQMMKKLDHTEKELSMLKDDMYQRQFGASNNQSMMQAQQMVPPATIYSPFKGGNMPLEAFKEKIDLAERKKELKQINSPYSIGAAKPQPVPDWAITPEVVDVDVFQQEQDRQDTIQDIQWVDQLIKMDSSDDEDMHLG